MDSPDKGPCHDVIVYLQTQRRASPREGRVAMVYPAYIHPMLIVRTMRPAVWEVSKWRNSRFKRQLNALCYTFMHFWYSSRLVVWEAIRWQSSRPANMPQCAKTGPIPAWYKQHRADTGSVLPYCGMVTGAQPLLSLFHECRCCVTVLLNRLPFRVVLNSRWSQVQC